VDVTANHQPRPRPLHRLQDRTAPRVLPVTGHQHCGNLHLGKDVDDILKSLAHSGQIAGADRPVRAGDLADLIISRPFVASLRRPPPGERQPQNRP